MRQFIAVTFISFMFACSDNGSGKHDEHDAASAQVKDTSKKSLPAEVNRTIAGADISIKYHSPAVRGRTIWGGLVAYEQVWVTGAHSATTLEISKDFSIQNRFIPAGKYAIFTIPSKDEWTVIINQNWDQHLADEYSEADDVARIKVKPVTAAEITERLKYDIEPLGNNKAKITISWEKIKVPFEIELRP
jgi:hypothetical protein